MITDVKVNGAFVKVMKRGLMLNSRLGSRISTAVIDILGEERWEEVEKVKYKIIKRG